MGAPTEQGHGPQCTPEWEPGAVWRTAGGLFHWNCSCGSFSLAPYIGQENARKDFVAHVLNRRAVGQ